MLQVKVQCTDASHTNNNYQSVMQWYGGKHGKGGNLYRQDQKCQLFL